MSDVTLPRPSPTQIDAAGRSWPLHDAAASRAIEAAALAMAAPHALMQRAGLSVARLAMAIAPHAQTVCVAAGPGNNGGDGMVAALHLHRLQRDVQVHLLGEPERLPPDARHAYEAALAAGVRITPAPGAIDGADLLIDALLGLGLTRPPEGPIAEAIARLNRATSAVLAIDLPSGLDGDTGRIVGEQAVRASATLSLLTLKPGLFVGHGRDHVGTVWFDDLEAGAGGSGACAWLPGRQQIGAAFEARAHASHKGSFGDVAVVGGAPGMGGAAALAARAALAAGAGRVYLSPLDAGAPSFDPGQPELMHRSAWWRAEPAVLHATTVVCGCGGGTAVSEALPALLSHAQRLVLDADALNAVAAEGGLQILLQARAQRGHATVLTPHPLEAARLLGCSATQVQDQRLAAAQTLAALHQCVVVLKGSGTVVATPSGLPSINGTGNGLLATAGTGDVLAGWIGGLWAARQSLAPADIARAAVWLHGQAADDELAWAGTSLPLRASDLVDRMRAASPR